MTEGLAISARGLAKRDKVEAGVDIYGVRPRRTTLEQLFLDRTGQPTPDALAPKRAVAA